MVQTHFGGKKGTSNDWGTKTTKSLKGERGKQKRNSGFTSERKTTLRSAYLRTGGNFCGRAVTTGFWPGICNSLRAVSGDYNAFGVR